MPKFNVDIAADATVTSVIRGLAKHGLVVLGLNLQGPAGGNPEFTLGGNRNDFASWLEENEYDGDISLYEIIEP